VVVEGDEMPCPEDLDERNFFNLLEQFKNPTLGFTIGERILFGNIVQDVTGSCYKVLVESGFCGSFYFSRRSLLYFFSPNIFD